MASAQISMVARWRTAKAVLDTGRVRRDTIMSYLEMQTYREHAWEVKDPEWINLNPSSKVAASSKALDPHTTYFVPIVLPLPMPDIEHWVLVVIKGRHADLYDSQCSPQRACLLRDATMNFLSRRLRCSLDAITFATHSRIAQQDDKTSSGLFVLMYATTIIDAMISDEAVQTIEEATTQGNYSDHAEYRLYLRLLLADAIEIRSE